MPLQIYNSLTRTKIPFTPLHPPQVTMYVCGPTVYDEPHIGHARSAYIFDVMRRYLTYRGYRVTFVRNVTDVDDKIIDKARSEFKGEDLNTSFGKVASKYLSMYHQALHSLGIATGPPDIVEPKASEYIDRMVSFIQRLIDRGVAYPSQADVYFDVTKAKDYGKLSHQSLERLEVGARVLQPEKKRNPLDFALWKSAKPDEPCWVSPWGKGRPGWHIECSVMSLDILGEAFDIHGGGVDLIFPHHENEIAQSEGAGMKFANIWVHHGLLTINAQKMSKSLGNFITISDFLNTYKDPDALKLFFLGTHYAHPIDYNDGKIEEMRKQKARFNNFFDLVNTSTPIEGKAPPALSAKEKTQCDALAAKFEAAMDNDFNTAQALASLFELIDYASAREGSFTYAKSTVEAFFKIFALSVKPAPVIPKELSALIAQRNKAKQDKDFDTADALRKVAEDTYHFLLSDTGTSVSATER